MIFINADIIVGKALVEFTLLLVPHIQFPMIGKLVFNLIMQSGESSVVLSH